MNKRNYYSQNGEDVLLWELFARSSRPGFFIEIGAFDGRLYSNSLSFEQAGWSGICVEPHPQYFALLQKNRPGSMCVNAAVGAQNKDQVVFYMDKRGVLSSLHNTNEQDLISRYSNTFTGFIPTHIPMKTVDTIISESKFGNLHTIDFVSIDVEGAELDVLAGFSLKKYKPRVLIVEANDTQMGKALGDFLAPAGYFKARILGKNVFYVRTKKDYKLLRQNTINADLIYFRHPLEDQGPLRKIVHVKHPAPLSLCRRILLKLLGLFYSRRRR